MKQFWPADLMVEVSVRDITSLETKLCTWRLEELEVMFLTFSLVGVDTSVASAPLCQPHPASALFRRTPPASFSCKVPVYLINPPALFSSFFVVNI